MKLISSIADLVQELPHKLANDLRSQSTLSSKIKLLKNMTVLLYRYFYNIPNKTNPLNIDNLHPLRSPNVGNIRVKVGPKPNYYSYILSSCTNRIAVFNNFFSLT